MNSIRTFYFSRVVGNKVTSEANKVIGKLRDLIVDISSVHPKVIAAKILINGKDRIVDISNLSISKEKGQYQIIYSQNSEPTNEFTLPQDNVLFLGKHVLDRQLVDMDGRKLVRVNDIRLAIVSTGTYTVAVDVGVEGFLRRLGIAKLLKKLLKPFGINLLSELILWDEVAAVDFFHAGIKLSKEQSKLSTLHPSDLADIIEELDSHTQLAIISSLDEEKAADVFEELETDVQISVLESLSVEKAADVLEKMPADEVADILDEMDEDRAEDLLNEMEKGASQEVRDLMEYPENTVGSFMTTDYISFNEGMTVEETIKELRKIQPEADEIYYLYILDDDGELVATVSLRDLIVSSPDKQLKEIMNDNVIFVYDDDKIDSVAEIISKYSLLALPVVDSSNVMQGIVVIDDVMYSLLKAKARKRM